jgi:putative hydrolase of the HAD superfamily
MKTVSRPVIFDLYHTLVDGADDERDRIVGQMAITVGVDPAELVATYHATWRDRLVRWEVEETVRILARHLGVTPTAEQVAQAAALRRALARWLLDTVSAETLDVLDMLRANGHPIALVSNATSDTAEAWPRSRLARCSSSLCSPARWGSPSLTPRSTSSRPNGWAWTRRHACSSAMARMASWPVLQQSA